MIKKRAKRVLNNAIVSARKEIKSREGAQKKGIAKLHKLAVRKVRARHMF